MSVDEWLDNVFEYLGSRVAVSADEVTVDQELYASGRLFTVDIQKDQHDLGPATLEQTIDNMSGIGALSWLASQTRPDLQAGVSMAQQLQRQPLVEDLKFTNSLAKKARHSRTSRSWPTTMLCGPIPDPVKTRMLGLLSMTRTSSMA